jgi:hypothetical protein
LKHGNFESIYMFPRERTISLPMHERPTRRGVTWWLIVLTILLASTWLFLGIYFYQRGKQEAANPSASVNSGLSDSRRSSRSSDVSEAPWGKLEIVPILISPPLELVPTYVPISAHQVEWNFPNTNVAELIERLGNLGLSESLKTSLISVISTEKLNPKINGYTIRPSRELVLGMKKEDRAKLYIALGAYKENGDQTNVFRFCGEKVEDWFTHSPISNETRNLVAPLVYLHEGFLFFADLRSIEEALPSTQERLKLVKTLSREATFLVKLKVAPDMDIEPLVNYWGRGGRAKDVRPLLQSLADIDEGADIDITHLIPSFARQRIYTYPVIVEDETAINQDCHWTALNFFTRGEPDNRYSNKMEEVVKTIQHDYYRVFGNYQLGDLVLFIDEHESLFHSAIYIADDILFTKNGNVSSQPWILMKLGDMKNFYPLSKPPDVRFYRRKDV